MTSAPAPYPPLTRPLDARPALARGLFLLALAVALAVAGTWVYRLSSIVTDENLYDDVRGLVTIISIQEGGASDRAGLRVGDVIIAVNGHPVANKVEANDWLVRGTQGKVLEYTIVREGLIMTRNVVLAEFGIPLGYFALLCTAAVLVATGAFVFLRRPAHPVARMFGWTTLTGALTLSLNRSYLGAYFPDAFTVVATALQPMLGPVTLGLIVHLSLYFPVRKYLTAYSRRIFVGSYGLPMGVWGLTSIITTLLFPGIAYLRILPFLGLVGGMVLALVLQHRRMASWLNPEYAKRARLPRAAVVLLLTLAGALSLVPERSTIQAMFFLLPAFPLLYLWTVIRQRLFDLYIVLRRSSIYSILTRGFAAAAVLVVAAMIVLLPRGEIRVPVLNISRSTLEIVRMESLTPERRDLVQRRMFLVSGMTLALMLLAGWRRGRRLLDERFHRGAYDYRLALREFTKLSRRFSDREALAAHIAHDLAALMHLKGAAYAARDGGEFRTLARRGIDVPDQLSIDADVLRALETRAGATALDNLAPARSLEQSGVEFLAPVLVDGRAEALILLGGKQAETNFTREDVELLDDLADNVADALVSMSFLDEMRESERMKRELEIARRIQLASLPAELPELPGIDVAARSVPAHEVGGDFYDVLPRHDSVTFVVGDVSGKGTSAALHLARVQGVMRTIDAYQPHVWELFTRLNTLVFSHLERRAYLTMSGLNIHLVDGSVTFIRAGHLPLLHYNALSREVVTHTPPGMGVGLDRVLFAQSLKEERIFARGGDVFALVTDGVTEATAPDGEHFGLERAAAILQAHAHASAADIVARLLAATEEFAAGAERHDDATVLIVKFTSSMG